MGEQGHVSDNAHRRLRISLIAGSLYDLTFAFINLAAPAIGAAFFEIPLPEQQVYLRFTGVFLIMLALFYMLPVIHPGRYLGNVVVAILGRGMGALFLIVAVTLYDQPRAFILLGMGDLVFAALHTVFLARAEGGNPFRHYLD